MGIEDRIRNRVRRYRAEKAGVMPGQSLLDHNVVDQELYEAFVGNRFNNTFGLMDHVVSQGLGRQPTSLLLDWAFIPADVVEKAKAQWRPWLVLAHIAKYQHRTSAFFDPSLLPDDGTPPVSRTGRFGDFARSVQDDTPLPGFPSTYGQVREKLIRNAWAWHEERALVNGDRSSDTWDEAAEEAFKAKYAHATIPHPKGEPAVSIVMPVRTRRDLVQVAIASVQGQTYPDWELIVVDDGSEDDTAEVVDAISAKDPRVRLVRGPQAGVSAARNLGIASATAPYTAFLDSDNTWRADFLQVALAAIYERQLQAAYAGLTYFDDDGNRRYRAFDGTKMQLEVNNHIDLNVLIVSTELLHSIGGFDVNLRRWVDHDLALRLSDVVRPTLLPFIAVDYDHDELADRITTRESQAWQFAVLAKRWTDWDAAERTLGDRIKGRVSIVIPTWNDARMTYRTLETIQRNTDGLDIEVIVVDNGSQVPYAAYLPVICEAFGAVYVRTLRNVNFAAGSNIGAVKSTGEYVLFLNNDTEPRPGWLPPLVAALKNDPQVLAVQPLLQYPDDSIQTAGTVFPAEGFLPTHFLVGHPPEDAERLTDKRMPALTAAALLMRAEDVITVRGFDPLYMNGWEDVDLCLKLKEQIGGEFLLVTESRVTHHESKTPGRSDHIAPNRQLFVSRWDGKLPGGDTRRWHDLGFETPGFVPEATAHPAARPVVVRPRSERGSDRLRWGLRLPSLGGEAGDTWGDTHFGASFASSLRTLGQDVVTHRHGAHQGAAVGFDDVSLTIRGLDYGYVAPGQVNVLWIISHPEMVTSEEIRPFDLVYAASAPWAAKMSATWGREIRPLLQATDLSRRADMSAPVGDGSKPVFVGAMPPHRVRPIVQAVLDSGIDATFHGPSWANRLPDRLVGRPYIPNTELAGVYREAGLVLADHHQDMAEEGFIANRLFDAVASGARVISDPVPGLELFGGAVQEFRDADDVRRLTSAEGRSAFPSDAEMDAIADRIAAEHSFEARARQMLADVLEVRSGR